MFEVAPVDNAYYCGLVVPVIRITGAYVKEDR